MAAADDSAKAAEAAAGSTVDDPSNAPRATPISMPKVKAEETADEERFECPPAWFLALVTVAMSLMTSITVVGSLFFLLAAPEKVSPHCYSHPKFAQRAFCTASTVAFWTYPVVCCLFVVLVYAKNLLDQRTYYEFLLHKVVIGFGRVQAWKNPVVLALLLYAFVAFSALVWFHYSTPGSAAEVAHVYASLAYITPIISFLAVIFTQWSIQGKLITLPIFMQDYDWAVEHLKTSRCYTVSNIHLGYLAMENQLDLSDDTLDTPQMIALVEHYANKVQASKKATDEALKKVKDDVEAAIADTPDKLIADTPRRLAEELAVAETGLSGLLAQECTESFLNKPESTLDEADKILMEKVFSAKEWVYWEVRMLFNPRLQDERSQSFRNWALAYLVFCALAILLSVYIFVCCLITCLEIEQVLTPGSPAWAYTHGFSLRPDLGAAGHSLKQVAASVAMSAMQTGHRSFFSRSMTPSHFQLGAAA